MDNQQKVDKGQRAERLLANSLLQEVFAHVEKKIDDGWKASAAEEQSKRENAYIMHRLLCNFKGTLEHYVRTGKHARNLLDTENN